MQSGFFDGDPLEGIGVFGGDDVEQRADLPFGEHVVVIGATGAGAGGLTSGILNKLADLFLESHFLEEFLDARFDGGIVQLGYGFR